MFIHPELAASKVGKKAVAGFGSLADWLTVVLDFEAHGRLHAQTESSERQVDNCSDFPKHDGMNEL